MNYWNENAHIERMEQAARDERAGRNDVTPREAMYDRWLTTPDPEPRPPWSDCEATEAEAHAADMEAAIDRVLTDPEALRDCVVDSESSDDVIRLLLTGQPNEARRRAEAMVRAYAIWQRGQG